MTRMRSIAAAMSLAMLSVMPALAQDAPPSIIVVSGPLFDPFFSALKKGADDAASLRASGLFGPAWRGAPRRCAGFSESFWPAI